MNPGEGSVKGDVEIEQSCIWSGREIIKNEEGGFYYEKMDRDTVGSGNGIRICKIDANGNCPDPKWIINDGKTHYRPRIDDKNNIITWAASDASKW